MLREAFEKFACCGTIVRMHFEPRVNKWANEPGPDRALMIRAVARPQVAAVNWFVIGIVRRERAEANGRDQFFFPRSPRPIANAPDSEPDDRAKWQRVDLVDTKHRDPS